MRLRDSFGVECFWPVDSSCSLELSAVAGF